MVGETAYIAHRKEPEGLFQFPLYAGQQGAIPDGWNVERSGPCIIKVSGLDSYWCIAKDPKIDTYVGAFFFEFFDTLLKSMGK